MKVVDILKEIENFLINDIIYLSLPLEKPNKLKGGIVTDFVISTAKQKPLWKVKIQDRKAFLDYLESYLRKAVKSFQSFERVAPLKTKKEPALCVVKRKGSLDVFFRKGKTKFDVLSIFLTRKRLLFGFRKAPSTSLV